MGRVESSIPSLIFIDLCYSSISEKPVRSTIAAKATSEGSESSTSISFKSIRNVVSTRHCHQISLYFSYPYAVDTPLFHNCCYYNQNSPTQILYFDIVFY